MNNENTRSRDELRAHSRSLHGHGPTTPAELLSRTAKWCADNDVRADVYGTGPLVENFEARVAELLGFEAARFMPSGTMAQQIALRVWAERARLPHVGMHPTSHLELHEQRGYAHLHGLRATLVGPASSPLLAEHLTAVSEPLAALLIELPIREAGGQLPTFDQLQQLCATAAAADVRIHLDGARLWECAAWFERPYADICAGFDSCYVSFYKGIGALPGSMLLGPADFISEAVLWQRRCGGNLYTLAPNVASAAMLLDQRLERMSAYYQRARQVAECLEQIEGVEVLPSPPHTNMMHVFLPVEREAALSARDAVASERGVWLFNAAGAADVPGYCRFELYIGEAAMNIDDADIVAGFRQVVAGGSD